MDKKKSLVILTPAFPGTESDSHWVPTVQIFARTLQDCFPNIRVEILAFNYPLQFGCYEWKGMTVTSFGGLNARKLQRLQLWIKTWRTLRNINRCNGIAGLLSFWCTECALIGSRFGRRHRIPHRIWISGLDATRENRYIKWIRPKPSDLITMSTFLANEFMKNHALMPAHTIIPGIDPMLYPAFDGQKDIDVMGAGSLIPLKQYKIFIRVVKAISIVRPTVKAVICGGGPEMADLAELVRDLGLEENIQFTDHCKQEEVLRLMQRSKIFLHPSAYEGFGMVCAEALFAAAHVISFIFPLTDRTPQWHVVKDENEMTATALMLLENRATPYDSILVQKMEASARQIMSLFANKTAVSA